MTRVFLAMPSDPQEKLPISRRSARYFLLPPRVRTVWIRLAPSFVIAAGRPNSNFRFLCGCGRLPPVFRRLCQWSRLIPMVFLKRYYWYDLANGKTTRIERFPKKGKQSKTRLNVYSRRCDAESMLIGSLPVQIASSKGVHGGQSNKTRDFSFGNFTDKPLFLCQLSVFSSTKRLIFWSSRVSRRPLSPRGSFLSCTCDSPIEQWTILYGEVLERKDNLRFESMSFGKSRTVTLCSLANFINAADRAIMPRKCSVVLQWAKDWPVPFLSNVVAIIPMAKEFHWNLRLQGYILSAFPIGYLTSQLFAHIFVRRFGTKTVLALAVFTWSLVTFATPFLAPLPFVLICSRIALGFGEGLGRQRETSGGSRGESPFFSALPTIFHVFSNYVPMEERSRSFSYLIALGSVGQTFAALVSTRESISFRSSNVLIHILGTSRFVLTLLGVLFSSSLVSWASSGRLCGLSPIVTSFTRLRMSATKRLSFIHHRKWDFQWILSIQLSFVSIVLRQETKTIVGSNSFPIGHSGRFILRTSRWIGPRTLWWSGCPLIWPRRSTLTQRICLSLRFHTWWIAYPASVSKLIWSIRCSSTFVLCLLATRFDSLL